MALTPEEEQSLNEEMRQILIKLTLPGVKELSGTDKARLKEIGEQLSGNTIKRADDAEHRRKQDMAKELRALKDKPDKCKADHNRIDFLTGEIYGQGSRPRHRSNRLPRASSEGYSDTIEVEVKGDIL
jgi:hypothetical protein